MTPRERYMTVLEGGRPDVLPRLPILMQFAAEHIGSYYGAFASDYRVLVEANLRCAEEFGIDQLNTMSDPYRETAGFGAPIEFPRNGVPICVTPPLEHRPGPCEAPAARSPAGAAHARPHRGCARLQGAAGGRFSIMGWVEGPAAEAADLRGVSNFFVDLLDDPAYAGALMARCVETAVDFARRPGRGRRRHDRHRRRRGQPGVGEGLRVAHPAAREASSWRRCTGWARASGFTSAATSATCCPASRPSASTSSTSTTW